MTGQPPSTAPHVADALLRLEEIVAQRADFGHSTDISVTTVVGGLLCRTDEKSWHFETDMPAAFGGSGAAPTPGVLARAALGSCLAMGYVMRAARHGVDLTSIRVTVEADSEVAGMLICGAEAPAGYREIRCHVDVESPADERAVHRILDEADSLSPILDLVGRANAVSRTTSIRPVGG